MCIEIYKRLKQLWKFAERDARKIFMIVCEEEKVFSPAWSATKQKDSGRTLIIYDAVINDEMKVRRFRV